MAPKGHMGTQSAENPQGKKRKSVASKVPRSTRSKKSQAPPPPEIVMQGNLAFFPDDELLKFNKDYSSRTIVYEKPIDFAYFEKEGFKFREWFEKQHWADLLVRGSRTIPIYVRQFYANLKHKTDDNGKLVLSTCLANKPITITEDQVNHACMLVPGGKRWYGTITLPSAAEVPNFYYDSAVMMLCGLAEEVPRDFQIEEKFLLLEFRLLHKFIQKNFLPRAGHFHEVTRQDVFLMWCIASGYKLDLAFFIMNHMLKCIKRKPSLKYPMIITLLCEEVGIDPSLETIFENCPEPFGKSTLTALPYHKDDEGIWVINPEEDVAPPVHPATSFAATPPNMGILDFLKRIDTKLDSLTNEVASLKKSQDASKIKTTVGINRLHKQLASVRGSVGTVRKLCGTMDSRLSEMSDKPSFSTLQSHAGSPTDIPISALADLSQP